MISGDNKLRRFAAAWECEYLCFKPKEHFMGTIITKSDKEVLHFFDEMKRVSDLIDHLPMDNRHLLDGKTI